MTTATEKPRTNMRLVAIMLVVALLFTVGYAVIADNGGDEVLMEEGGWATAEAKVGDLRITVTGTAPLSAGNVETVTGTLGGIVRRVYVEEGDRVAAGQVLAELDNETVLLDLEQAELEHQAEVDRLEDLRATSDGGGGAVRVAELAVVQAQENIARLEQQVAELVVRAPAAGQLTEFEVAVGDEVAAGATLATLLEGRPGKVQLAIPEDRLDEVRVGDAASVIAGPLPDVHVVKLSLGAASVYGLRLGDPVRATIDGQWVSSYNPSVRGKVVDIVKGAAYFDITCRLPGLSDKIPVGASVPYMEIYPSGRQAQGETLTVSGSVDVVTDEWGLVEDHLAEAGLSARISAIATEGKVDGSGEVTYAATLELLAAIEGARTGMTLHAAVKPANGDAISGVTHYEAPSQELTSESGGRVLSVEAAVGDQVAATQVLLTMDSLALRQQLEQARLTLVAKERELRELSGPDRADREVRSQEIKVRQAELAMIEQQEKAAGLKVVAETAGRVVGWHPSVAVGQEIGAGVEFCRLINYDKMSMVINVDEVQVVSLRPGMEAEVTVDALPGQPFPAQVREIAQEGNFERGMSTFEVTLEVEGADELRAQMTGNATILIGEKSGVLIVPAEAVTLFGSDRGEVSVLDEEGVPQGREVELGLIGRTEIEIVAGLEEGETVVLGFARGGGGPGFRGGRVMF